MQADLKSFDISFLNVTFKIVITQPSPEKLRKSAVFKAQSSSVAPSRCRFAWFCLANSWNSAKAESVSLSNGALPAQSPLLPAYHFVGSWNFSISWVHRLFLPLEQVVGFIIQLILRLWTGLKSKLPFNSKTFKKQPCVLQKCSDLFSVQWKFIKAALFWNKESGEWNWESTWNRRLWNGQHCG